MIVIIFENQPAVHFYTLNDCLNFCYNAMYRCSLGLKIFHRRFGRLAAAYCLAFHSNDLLVSSYSFS